MLNIRKRIFLFLTIIGIAVFFAGCTDTSNTVRLNFDQDEYTVRMYEQIDITPIIQKSASLGDITVIYESSDEEIATFKKGVVTPIKEGTVTIKIYWLDKPVVFDKATITVIKAALPTLDLDAPSKMLKGAKADVETILVKNYTNATVSFNALTPEIATISEAGEIEALAVGTAKFEAIVADYEDSKVYPFEVAVEESDFAITYDLAGGTNAAENPVGYNALKLPLAIAPATKVGYEFKGWVLNNKVVDAIPVESIGDVTLRASWEIINYEVTYENDGVAVENPATYNVENLPLALTAPTKAGYDFAGWQLGDKVVAEIPAGTIGDVTLKATYEKIPVVSNIIYNLDGGTLEGEYISTYVEGTGLATLPVPKKNGYIFDGWFIGDVKQESIGADAIGNVELTAHWTEEVQAEEFDIVYDLNGGTWSQTIKNGYTSYEDIVADVLKDFGMTAPVSVWSSTVDDKFRENMTKWGPLLDYFIATRGDDDGYLQKIKDCRAGTDLAGDVDPYVMTGEFKAFVEKGVVTYTAAAITSNDYSVEATRELIWNYFTKGTEEVTNVEHADTYEKSVGLATLATPLKAGDTFVGWYVGDVEWTSIPVGTTGTVNLKARWESEGPIAPTLSDIIYNLDGGTLADDAPKTYAEGVGLATLPVPTKEGFTFLGWYIGDVKQESIGTDATGNVELTAKWEVTVIEPSEYTLIFNLDGGSFAAVQFTSREEVMKAFLADMTTYLRSLGSTITEIKETEDLELNAEGKPAHVTDFMGVTYTYAADIEAFFTTHYAAKWGWMYTFIKNAGATTSSNTLIRANIHSFVYQTVWPTWPYSADFTTYDFDSFKDKLPEPQPIVAPDKYETGKALTLPVPSKEGMEFVGWFNGDVYVASITAETRGNLELTAKWRVASGEAGVIEVSAEGAYKTLAEAMAVVKPGETIKVLAGTYEGTTVNVANIKIVGPNAGVDPNTQVRAEEAIFTTDIIVAADDVTIDGIELTGKGRIVGDMAGTKNTTIKNVYINASTVNPAAADSAIAPITFYSNVANATFENLVLENLKNEGAKGRPMIFYGAQIVDFSLKNSSFVGTRSNYNDGLKFEGGDAGLKGSAFGVKGNVTIEGNHFENYAQYVIWFRQYAEGTYNIQNNTFKDCGQTPGSHSAVNFINYAGAADGKVTINIQYNTVDNSYMIARIDAAASRNADNSDIHINYNKLYNCAATYYIKNSLTYSIDGANNWYDTTPVAGKFLAVIWEPFYANADDVPVFGQPLNFHPIAYELNGGTLPAGTPATYDQTTGLSTLPTPTYAKHIFLGWYLNDVKVENIAPGTTGKVTLVAKWREDALYVGAGTEDYLYATIAEALAAAKEGDKIIILAGEYEESFTVSIANLTIVGANQDVNPNTGTRGAETILKGAITVDASASNLTLKGLAFTGAASIKNESANNLTGLVFENNKVYDTDAASQAWQETAGYTNGFMVFIATTSGLEVSNFMFINNLFENVSDANVVFIRSKNISFDGNVFKDFDRDAIRFDTGGYNYGTLAFTNNKFEQTVAGNGNHAIYFRIYGGPGTNDTTILIQDNEFIKIGNTTTTSIYNGAIGARNYQEKGAEWIVNNNIFDHCVNIARIRNNGTAANHATSTWSYTFENNQVLGVPTSFYYANKNSTSEADSTNPSLATFGANYYEDNDGNVITDLTAYAAMFKEVVTMGTALDAKPADVATERVEFYSISYDLDGGSAKGTFVTSYDRLTGAIAIPVPTKTNHQFLGWDLNGTYLTEVPANQRGNIVITAKWQVLEGEIYTIEYVTTQGNWPTRAAEDREEIIDLLWADLYEWATTCRGYTGTFEAYKTATTATIDAYTTINLRSGTLKDNPAEDGDTTYFYNIPKYYEKWAPFFRVFDAAMLKVNAGQSFFGDIYATMVRLSQFLNWTATGQNYFASFMPQFTEAVRVDTTPVAEYRAGQIVTLPVMWMGNGLKFIGWFDNAEFTGDPIVEIPSTSTGNLKFYAKWDELIAPTKVDVNVVSEILRFESYQLVWSITPNNATDQRVEFASSNEAVAKITSKGLITYVGIGSTEITMKVIGNRDLDVKFTVTYYSPDHMEGSFKDESYVKVGETIELEAAIVGKSTGTVVWTSENPEIATVDANGVVTAVKAGLATIVAKDSTNDDVKLAFIVSVLDEIPDGILGFALKQHNSNVFFKAELGIGAGIPVYYADILGSVSKMLFLEYKVNDQYYTANPTLANHSGTRTGALEFITVHYTGNMGATAGAGANARYFTEQSTGSSIHYVTGNDGVFYCYDESLVCWHAGDGTSVPFEWNATGVLVKADDPAEPVVTITANSKFAINGTETPITVPGGQKNTKVYGTDLDKNPIITPADSSYLTCQGLAVKVIDGQYYLGSARWDTSQVADGKVCSRGGNLNSIGIESAVNKGSDLWLTWQMTAQLVARLMDKYDLDSSRVKGHVFFSGKDCPQPLLENDCEIWAEFIKLVEAEYEALTAVDGYTVTCVSNNPELLDNTGRVIKQPDYATCVSYTLTFTKGAEVKTITLSSLIPGIYEK